MDFAKVEAEFKKLKGQFEAGTLTEAGFKARLQDLMIQDEQGRWWMIGYETGQWYYHDGEKWVQGEPPPVAEPHVAEASPVTTKTSRPAAMPSPPLNRLAIAAVGSGIAGLAIGPVIAGIDGSIGTIIGSILAMIFSVLALIYGYKARNEIRQRPSETSGERFAMAGIVIGWISLALWLLGFCMIAGVLLIQLLSSGHLF